MYEQFRNEMLVALSDISGCDTAIVLRILDEIALKYDIKRKETCLTVYQNDIPEAVKVYLVCKKMSGLADGTLENYKLLLTSFFREVQKPFELITANDIRMFLYLYQNQRSISARTVDKYRECISRFFTWACDEGYISYNPARNVVKIKYEEKRRTALTQTELEYLRLACKTLREISIIEFLYSTGCRVSELSIVTKSDVNWNDKTVSLFGKGKKHRISFLNAKAEVALIKYLESRNDDCEYLFVTTRKPFRKIGKDGIEKIVRKISRRASENIGKHVTPHILRHTTATIALQNGMPIADISKLLGHESIDTTMIYAESSLENVHSGHKKYIV